VTPHSKTVVASRGDGAYSLHGGAWNRITSRPIAWVSDGGSPSAARLWVSEYEGRVTWHEG
jgi:hypothetical protein